MSSFCVTLLESEVYVPYERWGKLPFLSSKLLCISSTLHIGVNDKKCLIFGSSRNFGEVGEHCQGKGLEVGFEFVRVVKVVENHNKIPTKYQIYCKNGKSTVTNESSLYFIGILFCLLCSLIGKEQKYRSRRCLMKSKPAQQGHISRLVKILVELFIHTSSF